MTLKQVGIHEKEGKVASLVYCKRAVDSPCEGHSRLPSVPHGKTAFKKLELTEILLKCAASHEVSRNVGSRLKMLGKYYLY